MLSINCWKTFNSIKTKIHRHVMLCRHVAMYRSCFDRRAIVVIVKKDLVPISMSERKCVKNVAVVVLFCKKNCVIKSSRENILSISLRKNLSVTSYVVDCCLRFESFYLRGHSKCTCLIRVGWGLASNWTCVKLSNT